MSRPSSSKSRYDVAFFVRHFETAAKVDELQIGKLTRCFEQ